MTSIQSALQIALYGMGLVFIGILLLWGMMAVMVMLFPDHRRKTDEKAAQSSPDELDNKRLAAAIAVATAVEMHNTSIQSSSHKERENISAWQAAHRSRQMSQTRTISLRKR